MVTVMARVKVRTADPAAQDAEQHLSEARNGIGTFDDAELTLPADHGAHAIPSAR